MKTLGERLKFARERKGPVWTQKHLALAAGVSVGLVGMLESGARGNTGRIPGSVPALAKVLGVRYDWLAYGEGPLELEFVKELEGPSASINEMPPEIQVALEQLGVLLALIPAESRDRAYQEATSALIRHLPGAAPKRALALARPAEK